MLHPVSFCDGAKADEPLNWRDSENGPDAENEVDGMKTLLGLGVVGTVRILIGVDAIGVRVPGCVNMGSEIDLVGDRRENEEVRVLHTSYS
jgi:hypothetical protein